MLMNTKVLLFHTDGAVEGSVPLAVHPEFMPFFISRPACESPLAPGIKNTGKPQREGTRTRTTRLFSLISQEHISQTGLEKMLQRCQQPTLGEIIGNWAAIPALGTYVKFKEQRPAPRTAVR